ncbi:DUF1266 domain-containing protein [Brenneria populi]|uniref:DUF1266 domain-containing protein n=1 Tax=Brenneria populi TaxID=1505588 RepID=A0ABU6JRP8_9GAMM|nr:DUF1266 domain-containing protein [Brenneria populi Li et al. 2015]
MEPEHQRWLLALSAPMAALNIKYGANYGIHSLYPPGSTVDLNDSWGIDSRDTLIATINNMTDGGHAEHLAYHYFLWHHISLAEWRDYCAHQAPEQQAIMTLVGETAALCGEGGIRAWDLGRMSFLSRIGVLNGWINETESLWLHTRLADRARYYYRSWQNYFAAFFVGRTYWLASDEDDPILQRHAYSHYTQEPSYINQIGSLYTHPDSPIHDLEWDVNVFQIDRPESLSGVEI